MRGQCFGFNLSTLIVQVLWHLPETLCKDVLTDKVSVAVALQKQDIAFAKWLQGIGSSLDLRDTVRFYGHHV